MGRKYLNPPIIEAVCEFRLTPDSKWDLTVPGLLYEKIQDEFPNKEQRLIREMDLDLKSLQVITPQVHTSERILFLTEDKKMFVQMGSHLLSVNCLKPYPTWERFKPTIEKAFRAIIGIFEVKGLQRIGLRYVNRIEIPSQSVKLEDYFDFYPFLGQKIPQLITTFIVGCVLLFFDGRDLCKVQLTDAAPEKPDNSAYLLDLDYFLAQPQLVSIDKALEWIEGAHQQVEEIFEGCINDRLREIFQEIK